MKPDDGYIAYIVNPKSGASSGEKLPGWRFEEYLTGRGFDVRMNLTRSLEHACELATNAAADDKLRNGCCRGRRRHYQGSRTRT